MEKVKLKNNAVYNFTIWLQMYGCFVKIILRFVPKEAKSEGVGCYSWLEDLEASDMYFAETWRSCVTPPSE